MVAVIGNIGYVSTDHYSFYMKLISSYPTLSSVLLPFISLFGGLIYIWNSGLPSTYLLVLQHPSLSSEAQVASTDQGAPSPAGWWVQVWHCPYRDPSRMPLHQNHCLADVPALWETFLLCYGKLLWVPENPIWWKKAWLSRYYAFKKKFTSRI